MGSSTTETEANKVVQVRVHYKNKVSKIVYLRVFYKYSRSLGKAEVGSSILPGGTMETQAF